MSRTTPTRRDMLAAAAAAATGAGAAGIARAQEPSEAEPPEGAPLEDAAEETAAGAALTIGNIAAAEKLTALEYTPAEREQMLDSLETRLDVIRSLRALELPNELAPALTFDPRLPGVDYPEQDNSVVLDADTPALPGTPEAIAFARAIDQGRWIANGDITSRELTEIYLDRIERHAPRLECFVTVTPEIARAQADAADAEIAAGRPRGPLHGVPCAIKDLFDAEGTPTTWGAEPYRDRQSTGDSAVAARLKDAGAVLLGKTTLGALAYGDIWFGGVTRNPFNPAEGSSGSSAGSASAAAAGLCGFAIGTETLGSLISPSERCGTATVRPTFGRVSRAGAMALCWSLDKIGPLTRSIADCPAVLAALNGHDPADAGSIAAGFAFDASAPVAGMRVGYDPAWYEDADPLDAAAWETLKGLGIEPVEFSMPDLPYAALDEQLLAEAAAAFAELTLTNRDDLLTWQEDAAWPNSFRAARTFSAVDLIQVDRMRRRLMVELHAAMEGLDAVAGPSFAGAMLRATNFTGHPQAAVRAGFNDTPTRTIFGEPADESGTTFRTPHSFSIWAPLLRDGDALRLAAALERELGVWAEAPGDFS